MCRQSKYNPMNYHQRLLNIITIAKEQLYKMSSEEFNHKPASDKWSKKEIIGHLIDSAYNNHRRILLATQQDHLVFDGYGQDGWVIKNKYQERKTEEVIELWFLVNQHMAYMIENLPLDILQRTSTNHNFHKICMNLLKEGEVTSLSYLIWDYIFHLEHHLSQIIEGYVWINPDF